MIAVSLPVQHTHCTCFSSVIHYIHPAHVVQAAVILEKNFDDEPFFFFCCSFFFCSQFSQLQKHVILHMIKEIAHDQGDM